MMLNQKNTASGGSGSGAAAAQENDFGLSLDEVKNSWFYGATFARLPQMAGLSEDVVNKTDS